MQIPKQWWIPAVAEPARREGNTRRFISLKEVIEIQLAADADTIWLPKYLLVLYQLSMYALTYAYLLHRFAHGLQSVGHDFTA